MADRVKDKIPFHSDEGQRMLKESPSHQMILIRLFKEQENDTFCGIQSSALVMSARHLGQKYPKPSEQSECPLEDIPYKEGNMFDFEETKRALDFETIDKAGATMLEIETLLKAHGLPVVKVHVDDSSVDEFRTLASSALSLVDSQKGVIVNYDEYDLGQNDYVHGHFSLLAGYHQPSDRFLLLDTWFDTTDCWVKAEDLFHCMNTFDKDAGKYRGFMIVG